MHIHHGWVCLGIHDSACPSIATQASRSRRCSGQEVWSQPECYPNPTFGNGNTHTLLASVWEEGRGPEREATFEVDAERSGHPRLSAGWRRRWVRPVGVGPISTWHSFEHEAPPIVCSLWSNRTPTIYIYIYTHAHTVIVTIWSWSVDEYSHSWRSTSAKRVT